MAEIGGTFSPLLHLERRFAGMTLQQRKHGSSWPGLRPVLLRKFICRLTHPAVRNQQQILHLAAHQLVYHMPMPKLLLEADDARAVDTEMHSPEPKPPAANRQVPSREGATSRDQGRKPLLPLLLSEGVYEVIVTALSAWVLVSLR